MARLCLGHDPGPIGLGGHVMGEIDAGSFRQITRENGASELPDRRGRCAAERAGGPGDQDDVAGKRL